MTDVRKSTGEVNYYTQCYNFWKNGCPRKTGSRIKCRDCQKQSYRYGSMNFLGKEDAEDNLMRIADELLEMTFGNEKCQGETM